MLSVAPANKLVIFIHGFGGGSMSTWKSFPSRILEDIAFANVDVVFYGYDSQRQATNSAVELLAFLNVILDPNAVLPYPAEVQQRGAVHYDSVLLSCHSLGAVVARQALLMARRDPPAWLDLVKLLLFAPAHAGSNLLQLLVSCLSSADGLFAFFGMYRIPVLQDLKPGSFALNNLQLDTRAVIESRANLNIAIASNVIWADDERVVHNAVFCDDPNAILANGTTHTTVCKPITGYRLPVESVHAAL